MQTYALLSPVLTQSLYHPRRERRFLDIPQNGPKGQYPTDQNPSSQQYQPNPSSQKGQYPTDQNPSSQQYRPNPSAPNQPHISYPSAPPQPHISYPSAPPQPHISYQSAPPQPHILNPLPPSQSYIPPYKQNVQGPTQQQQYIPAPPSQSHISIPKPSQQYNPALSQQQQSPNQNQVQHQQYASHPQPQTHIRIPQTSNQQHYSSPPQQQIPIPQPPKQLYSPASQKPSLKINYSTNQFNPYDPAGRPIQFPPGTPHYIKEYHDHHAISHTILSKLKNNVRTSRATNLTEADLDYIFELAKEGRSDEEMQTLVGPLLRNLDFLDDEKQDESQNGTLSSAMSENTPITLHNSTLPEISTKSNHTVHESMRTEEDVFGEADKSGFKPPEIQRGFLPLVPYSDKDPGPTLVSLSNFPVSSPRVSRGLLQEKLIVSLTSNDKEIDTKTV